EEERHRRVRSERGCHQSRRADGSAQILYRSSADEVAEIWSVIRAFTERRFTAARTGGVRDSHDNYCADGMLDMARAAATTCGGASSPTGAPGANPGAAGSVGAPARHAPQGRQPRLPLEGENDLGRTDHEEP